MKDYFLEGLLSDNTKRDVMASPLWSVAVACINQTNGGVVVGDVYKFDGNEVHSLSLVTPSGFQVGCVHRDSASDTAVHKFGVFNSPYRSSTAPSQDVFDNVKSRKIPYIIRKIKTSGSDPYNALLNAYTNAQVGVNNILSNITNKLIHETKAVRPSRVVDLDEESTLDLLRFYKKDIDTSQISGQIQFRLDKAYERYKEFLSQTAVGISESMQFFDKNKWVVFNRLNNNAKGVIVGAVSREPLLRAVEHYNIHSSLPQPHQYTYVDMIVPFKWYRSVNDIPEDIRRDIEMQLTMAKVNMRLDGADLLSPERYDFPTKAIPELGTYISGDLYRANIFLVDKSI